MKNEIIIGTRASRLALIQAEMVQKFIEENNPGLTVRLLPMKTTGDVILNQSLDRIGGKGLFVKELDRALMEGSADICVHSLKDVPMVLPEELPLIAFSPREDARDVLVLPEGYDGSCNINGPSGPIGCSSKRRTAQYLQMHPDAQILPVRGNVQTRLRKLDDGEYGGLILAAAGLKRLGLQGRISRYFSTEEMMPAAGQGVIAVQGRAGEDCSYLEGFTDPDTEKCALAERAFMRELGGDCTTSAAVYGQIKGGQMTIHAMYVNEETGKMEKGKTSGDAKGAEELGRKLAISFLNNEW